MFSRLKMVNFFSTIQMKYERIFVFLAAMFPFIASGFLFGIYVVILLVSKEYITFVLNIYFFFIGVIALFRAVQPVLGYLRLPALDKLRERQFHVTLSENKPPTPATTTTAQTNSSLKDLMHLDFKFDLVDVGTLFLCVLVGVWYLLKRHWIANNIFGIAFSINAIEILHFNKYDCSSNPPVRGNIHLF